MKHPYIVTSLHDNSIARWFCVTPLTNGIEQSLYTIKKLGCCLENPLYELVITETR